MPQTDERPNKKATRNSLNWFLWWRVDEDELSRQVCEYADLKLWQSARGLSVLLLLLSTAVTAIMVFANVVPRTALVDGVLFVTLGAFIYFGHRWAMIAAMLLWTFEKADLIYHGIQSHQGSSPVTQILWWVIYMHAFFLAFRVEQARRGVPTAIVCPRRSQGTAPK